jgi:hypothetical protein
MILRGETTVEYRSRRTRIIGERFYIYAPRKCARPRTNGLYPPAVQGLAALGHEGEALT